MAKFIVEFMVEELVCNAHIQAQDWTFALNKFWETFDPIAEDGTHVEVLTINGVEPSELRDQYL